MQQPSMRNLTANTLAFTLLFFLTSAAHGYCQKQRPDRPPTQPTLEERIETLTAKLELSSEQVREMRSIVKGSHELAILDRNRLSGDYHKLALANRERVKRDAARIEALLTETQWEKYQELKKEPETRRIDRDTEYLIQRLNLNKEQKALFLDITAISKREMRGARGAFPRDSERGGGMQAMRAIQSKADKAIEKILSDEQKKEYKKYKKERDQKMQADRRGNRSGKGSGPGGGRGRGGGARGGW